MKHKELFIKLGKVQSTSNLARIKHLEYLAAIQENREAVDSLSEFFDKFFKLPHIDVEDFEIDG